MPPIVEGQTFPTLTAFKEALREWAVEENFTPHILDSDKQRVRAGCRSGPDCTFRIRVNYNIKLRAAKVTTVSNKHNCLGNDGQRVQQNCKRSEVAKLSFLVKAVPELLGGVDRDTRPSQIIEVIERKYGQKLLHRQAQKVKQYLCRKPCRYCHQFGHINKDCPQRPPDADVSPVDDAEVSSGTERPRKRSRCLVCFQTGHNRKNCPQKDSIESQNQDAAMLRSQLTTAAYAPNLPPDRRLEGTFGLAPVIEDEPDLGGSVDDFDNLNTQTARSSAVPQGLFPPNRSIEAPRGPSNPRDTRSSRSPPRATSPPVPAPLPRSTAVPNPKEQAARLMHQAASLMQEAARLNFEAARLTASLPE